MVLPLELTLIPDVPTKDEDAGALIPMTLPFVPDRVMLLPPLRAMVEPLAVVLPVVLPVRLNQLFSAAAPGAATDRDNASPAVLWVMDPEIFAPVKPDVVPAADPAFNDSPELFTVQARGPAVRAVFRPIASLLALAVVRPLWDAVTVLPAIPKEIPLELDHTAVQLDTELPAAETATPPPPGAAADRLKVKPALLLAVVPLRFVRASVGLP
jgi:hypothetical protein